MLWLSGGARSVASTTGSGGYSFVLPRGAFNVACGPTTALMPSSPGDLIFAVLVDYACRWRVIDQHGVSYTAPAALPFAWTRFHFIRVGAVLYVTQREDTDASTTTAVHGATLPGTVVAQLPIDPALTFWLGASIGAESESIYEARAEAAGTVANSGRATLRTRASLHAGDVAGAVASLPTSARIAATATEGVDYTRRVNGMFTTTRARVRVADFVARADVYYGVSMRIEGPNHTALKARHSFASASAAGANARLRAPGRLRAQASNLPNGSFGEVLLPAVTSAIPASADMPAEAYSWARARDGVNDMPPALRSRARAVDWLDVEPAPPPALTSEAQAQDWAKARPVALAFSAAGVADRADGRASVYELASAAMAADQAMAWAEQAGLASGAAACDRTNGIAVEALHDGAGVLDWAAYAVPADALASAAAARDDASGWPAWVWELGSSAAASDGARAPDVSPARLRDGARALDAAYAVPPDSAATAVVMVAGSGALHTWVNWPFHDLAQTADGTILAVGPAGLAVIGAGDDDGSPIASRLAYGALEFGGYDQSGAPKPAPQRKRMPGVWLGMQAEAPMQVSLKAGNSGWYTYPTRQPSSPGETNHRALPGRGLVGRWWQLALENTASADFEVSHIAADIVASERRI